MLAGTTLADLGCAFALLGRINQHLAQTGPGHIGWLRGTLK
jgi:hypothetical protein